MKKASLVLKEVLSQRGDADSTAEAYLLLSEVLQKDVRQELILRPEQLIDEATLARLDQMLARRRQGEPLAYILGYKDFYKSRFKVGPGVLIPRKETEHLVACASVKLRDFLPKNAHFLDVGTGSGCILYSLAADHPQTTGEGWDVCDLALAYARENAGTQRGGSRITLKNVDVHKATVSSSGPVYDMIVSNPPYISYEEKAMLAPQTGNDGLGHFS